MSDLRICKPGKKTGFAGILTVPIYHARIQFYPTIEDAEKDITGVGDLNGGSFGAVTFMAGNEGNRWLNIVFRDEKHITPEVIAHEATHAAWDILKLAGVRVTYANHEQLAYLIGYIVEQLHKFADAYYKFARDKEQKDGKPTP